MGIKPFGRDKRYHGQRVVRFRDDQRKRIRYNTELRGIPNVKIFNDDTDFTIIMGCGKMMMYMCSTQIGREKIEQY